MSWHAWAAALATALFVLPTSSDAQTWRTATATRQVRGEEQLDVSVQFAAGTFRLHPGEHTSLYRTDVRYDQDRFASETRYDAGHGRLVVKLTPDEKLRDVQHDRDNPQYLSLALSPIVPIDLTLEFGMANADLELGGLSLRQASLKTGASESLVRFSELNHVPCRELEIAVGAAELVVEGLGNSRCRQISVVGGAGSLVLDFTGAWIDSASSETAVAVGLGSLTLRLPEDLGVEVRMTRLLASFTKEGFERRGSRYVSPNYDQARAHVRLHVKAALGDIDVEWVPAR